MNNSKVACPCCGYRTLEKRSENHICPICYWEDEGQDSINADEHLGGPNYELSLTEARINFLKHGISDPSRTDLMDLQEGTANFEQCRIFQLVDGKIVESSPPARGDGAR